MKTELVNSRFKIVIIFLLALSLSSCRLNMVGTGNGQGFDNGGDSQTQDLQGNAGDTDQHDDFCDNPEHEELPQCKQNTSNENNSNQQDDKTTINGVFKGPVVESDESVFIFSLLSLFSAALSNQPASHKYIEIYRSVTGTLLARGCVSLQYKNEIYRNTFYQFDEADVTITRTGQAGAGQSINWYIPGIAEIKAISGQHTNSFGAHFKGLNIETSDHSGDMLGVPTGPHLAPKGFDINKSCEQLQNTYNQPPQNNNSNSNTNSTGSSNPTGTNTGINLGTYVETNSQNNTGEQGNNLFGAPGEEVE